MDLTHSKIFSTSSLLYDSRYETFWDVETTGFDPFRNSVISLACVLRDRETGRLHEFYEECRPEFNKREYVFKGKTVELWSKDAERVHGISWSRAQAAQHPTDLCVKLTRFMKPFATDSRYLFIYHANTNFDFQFIEALMAKQHQNLHWWFQRRFHPKVTVSTMKLARAYNKSNNQQLKVIKDIDTKLSKPRKVRLSDKKKNEWNEKQATARDHLSGKILFEGVSLDKICKALSLPLNHHNALSDTKVLPSIYDYLLEQNNNEHLQEAS